MSLTDANSVSHLKRAVGVDHSRCAPTCAPCPRPARAKGKPKRSLLPDGERQLAKQRFSPRQTLEHPAPG